MAVRFFLLEATKHIGGHHHEEQTHENHISNEDVMKERSASDKATDPLPSWADGPAKSAIVQFVQSVTEKGGKDYVPSEERIATFDNDGTLWVEYPLYTQLFFAVDRGHCRGDVVPANQR